MKHEAFHTLLFVDDDPAVLEHAKEALSGESHLVLTLTDPLQALPTIEWEHVDLVVSDMNLTQTDGIGLMARIRALYPWVMRVFLTAGGSFESAVRAVNEAEPFRIMRKPLSTEDLRGTIKQALRRLDAERRSVALERAAAARRAALADLEVQHAGISALSLDRGIYVLETPRLRELAERFADTPLAKLL